MRAATWASTSLPLFEPAATMAVGLGRSATSVRQRAQARRRVGGEPVVLGDVGSRHSVRAELSGGRLASAGAHEQRRERLAAGQLAGKRKRLQRQLVNAAGLMLDED